MRYLITGGCGFLGTNLAVEVLHRGEELFILDNLSRLGSKNNLDWLRTCGDFKFYEYDIRNYDSIEKVIRDIRPNFVFHLAGQVAMTVSIKDPLYDFEVNAMGTLNLLEAIKKYSPESIILYSSTNKVYGDLEWIRYSEDEKRYNAIEYQDGLPESLPLDFHSPYGCSKGVADQYMLDFYRIFKIRTVVFRHSSMYGGRQFATYDQGWVGWLCQKTYETLKGILKEPFTISGNGKQVRDLLFSDDLVNLYFKTCANIDVVAGKVFNIGGGMQNSLSILELFDILQKLYDIQLNYYSIPPRISDQKFFVANLSKIKQHIGWQPEKDIISGIKYMMSWIEEIYG